MQTIKEQGGGRRRRRGRSINALCLASCNSLSHTYLLPYTLWAPTSGRHFRWLRFERGRERESVCVCVCVCVRVRVCMRVRGGVFFTPLFHVDLTEHRSDAVFVRRRHASAILSPARLSLCPAKEMTLTHAHTCPLCGPCIALKS